MASAFVWSAVKIDREAGVSFIRAQQERFVQISQLLRIQQCGRSLSSGMSSLICASDSPFIPR